MSGGGAETVLAAVRRLNAAHPGLPRRKLIAPVGAVLERHMLHGESAETSIAALEALYRAAAGKP